MKNKLSCVVCLGLLASQLVGCSGDLSVKTNKKEVEDYNVVVEKTLKAFTDGVTESQNIQNDLYKFILTDELVGSLKVNKQDTLSEDIIEEFKTNILVDDLYLTSYGASNLREVVIFNSANSRLIATIIWNDDGSIDSIERVVTSI